jgi:hypothetical protein
MLTFRDSWIGNASPHHIADRAVMEVTTLATGRAEGEKSWLLAETCVARGDRGPDRTEQVFGTINQGLQPPRKPAWFNVTPPQFKSTDGLSGVQLASVASAGTQFAGRSVQ